MNQIDTLSVNRDPDFIRRRNPEGKFRSSGTSAGMCSSGL